MSELLPLCQGFPTGTLILTNRGYIPIEHIEVGDTVLTHEGQYRRVLRTIHLPFSGKMVSLACGKDSVIIGPHHLVLIARNGHMKWRRAHTIQPGDFVFFYFLERSGISQRSVLQRESRKHEDLVLYDLEIEEDHSYIANNFAVYGTSGALKKRYRATVSETLPGAYTVKRENMWQKIS